MLLCGPASSKQYMVSERDTKTFQLMIASRYYQNATEELANYLMKDGTDKDDKKAVQIQAIVDYYDTNKEQLQTDLQLLDAEIESLDKLVDESAKDSGINLSK